MGSSGSRLRPSRPNSCARDPPAPETGPRRTIVSAPAVRADPGPGRARTRAMDRVRDCSGVRAPLVRLVVGTGSFSLWTPQPGT